jgi:hypothetical protein
MGGRAPVSLAMPLVALGGACAAGWVVWGTTCLVSGPRLRQPALVLAWVMAVLTVAALAHNLVRVSEAHEKTYRYSYNQALTLRTSVAGLASAAYSSPGAMLRLWLAEAALPVALLVLLTRPPVKELFTRRPRPVKALACAAPAATAWRTQPGEAS